MRVTETAQVRAQIKAFKHLLEKPELFNHAVQMNERFYYNVQYWKWGGKEAVGYLILRPDGEIVPRREAEPVVRLFMSHNNAVINFTKDFAADKEKPVWMYEQKRDILQALLPDCEASMDVQTQKDARQLIDVCEFVVDGRDRLRDIFEAGMRAHQQMLARGYVISEDETALRNALYESDYLLYERLRRQVEVREAVDRLSVFFANNRLALSGEQLKKKEKLSELLRRYKDEGLRKTNDESVRSFETQSVSYQSAEQLAESYREQNDALFQRLVVSILRNP
ncbi:hypothetical protein AN963_28140 [Brevibacillus choshinensis]|uniref:Uncharacterized protein n=1 Tax=Brevibacillus choshinensis TaxID=54911 RepID=A0ABR5N4H7_BRECH|nr:hypothetical protein [Brevibacillus choshinensis]KQL45166.1 hypothetical protein AN963_28140 [Brevibacillus choshinensis]